MLFQVTMKSFVYSAQKLHIFLNIRIAYSGTVDVNKGLFFLRRVVNSDR